MPHWFHPLRRAGGNSILERYGKSVKDPGVPPGSFVLLTIPHRLLPSVTALHRPSSLRPYPTPAPNP
jgi:hypothetical protein